MWKAHVIVHDRLADTSQVVHVCHRTVHGREMSDDLDLFAPYHKIRNPEYITRDPE